MTLPTLTMPPGIPYFLAEGHAIELLPVYADMPQASGHSRRRPIRTAASQIRDVALALNEQQMYSFNDWYENTLLSGSLPFSARVQNQGPGLLWWTAIWKDAPISDPRGNGRWRVTGKLVLSGTGSVSGPEPGVLSVRMGVNISGSATLVENAALAVTFGVAITVGAALNVRFGVAIETQEVSRIAKPSRGSIAISTWAPTVTVTAFPESEELDSDAIDDAFGSVVGSLLRRGYAGWELLLPGDEDDVLTMVAEASPPALLPEWAAPAPTSSGGLTIGQALALPQLATYL